MRTLFLTCAWIAGTATLSAQSSKPTPVNIDNLPNHSLRQVQNNAFQVGERSVYRLHYGVVDAGIATITVNQSDKKFGGRDCYHVVGEGYSVGSFDWFFKVRDKYESYIDKQALVPLRFKRNCDEGGFLVNQDYYFFQHKRAFKNRKGEGYSAPANLQDMVSAVFYARTLDFSSAKEGDIFTIPTLVDDEIYKLKMKYVGKETVKVDAGTFKCLRFVPIVQKGRIFKKQDDLSVWVTDDAHHLPILAQAKIQVGSVKMELKEFSGIDLSSVKK